MPQWGSRQSPSPLSKCLIHPFNAFFMCNVNFHWSSVQCKISKDENATRETYLQPMVLSHWWQSSLAIKSEILDWKKKEQGRH